MVIGIWDYLLKRDINILDLVEIKNDFVKKIEG